MTGVRTLASDNHAEVHPEVMAALAAANHGPCPAYGADGVTAAAVAALRAELDLEAEVAFVFNGTGANVVCLQLMLQPWQHVVCPSSAHIAVDECGAAERLLGTKVIAAEAVHGRLTPEAVRAVHRRIGDEHSTQPGVVSISQSTELGTVYTPDEVGALAATAHELGMFLHMDGARLANAAAALDVPLGEITARAGVDALSFGGTKNGLLGVEAVVVFADGLKGRLPYVRKQLTQLGSKGRFLGAQFLAMLTDDLWRRNAAHANAMAARLHDGLAGVPGIGISHPRQANAVFATIPTALVEPLQKVASFHVWGPGGGPDRTQVRLMCSWDTSPDLVGDFVDAARALTGADGSGHHRSRSPKPLGYS